MITLPTPLAKVMQSGDLKGIKPFAVLIRNKWYAEESASGFEESDSGSDLGGHFALDMANPIDISSMIVKPNTLSMTLDVNEVAQYKANNVTLTIYDPFNRFIEGTPQSYFPQGYQLYGSQVVLYYGLDETNRTPLFVGVIKDLPTHKPEQYQVDLKLISPLELLSDIEAKEFSNKYYNETLTSAGTDDDNNPIYQTAHTGVGGFYAIYANGQKMFEGVDYEVSQLNELSLPALVTIINADYHNSTITADYYCWKTGLTVEQIVEGLVALGGYIDNTDIRNVVWNTSVTTQYTNTILGGLVFRKNISNQYETYITLDYGNTWFCYGVVLNNFKLEFRVPTSGNFSLFLGDTSGNSYNSVPANGLVIKLTSDSFLGYILTISYYVNNNVAQSHTEIYGSSAFSSGDFITIERGGNGFTIKISKSGQITTYTDSYTLDLSYLFYYNNYAQGTMQITYRDSAHNDIYNTGYFGGYMAYPAAILLTDTININSILSKFNGTIEGSSNYNIFYRYGISYNVWNNWEQIDFDADIGRDGSYFQFLISISYPIVEPQITVYNLYTQFLSSTLTLQFANLSGKTVLEALQDFALISGYEFGVDRQGTFFFRPRSQSTTPIYDLDSNEIVKIDNINKKFNDFFTKLTLTFAQVPLEFYANEGTRPTPIDKYGVINKEIDKPDIVNYDNPELAQAIGPQLLAIYSNLADIIQLTGKLNLNLELGDIINVKRNYNLTAPESASDYDKFICQNTYYQAAKITGLNYNFDKRQITYTLRNVSNSNNQPQPLVSSNQFPYDLPINF